MTAPFDQRRASRAFLPLRLCAALLAASGLAVAAPGDLDPAFGTAGRVTTNFSSTVPVFGEGRGIAVQGDGKYVVCGDSSEGSVQHYALLRYNPEGTLDASFGTGGLVRNTALGGYSYCNMVAVQPADQKIVAVGFNDANANDFTVVRYNANGTLDTGFGSGGVVTVDFAAGQDRANDVVIQPDGKILVAGWATGTTTGRDFGVVRLNANGALDNTFGCGTPGSCTGKATVAISTATERGRALALDASGKIIVAGDSGTLAAIARLNANGTLDGSFGGGGTGWRTMNLSNNQSCLYGYSDKFHSVTVLANGKIVASGDSYSIYHNDPLFGTQLTQMAFFQFNADGTTDTGFGPGGTTSCAGSLSNNVFPQVANTTPGLVLVNVYPGAYNGGQSAARRVREAAGGKIVGIGYGDTNGAGLFDYAAVRLTATGALDTTFGCPAGTGCTGKVASDLNGLGRQDFGVGGTVDAAGRIVLTGYSYVNPSDTSTPNVGTVRYTAGGVLDTAFNGTGMIFTQMFGGSQDHANALALQADGKVVLGGSTYNGSNSDFALARYTTGGALDGTFGSGGKVALNSAGGANDYVNALAIRASDGAIFAAGQAGTDLVVAKFSSSGALDGAWGTGGYARAAFTGTGAEATAIAILPDNRVVAAGINYPGGTNDAVVARFTASGALDGSFGSGGRVTLNWGTGTFDEIHAIALQPDGKLLVAGRTTAPPGGTYFKIGLARLTDTGALDTTFGCPAGTGCTGRVVTGVNTGSDEAYAIALQPDGRIVLGGKSNTTSGTNDFLAVRYNANGTLDTTFGAGGSRIVAVRPSDNDAATGMALRVDGKIVLFGSAFNGANDDFAVALLTRDGALDTSFGTGGTVLRPANGGNDYANGIAIAANGNWVLGGQDGGPADFIAARMLAPAHEPFPIALTPASDSGASPSDGITKVKRPTVAGTCFRGESVTLRADGGAVAAAVACATNDTFSATPTADLADGTYAITATATNANGTSTPTTPALSVTIDTVALPPAIGIPAAGASVPVSTTISGSNGEPGATVRVVEGAATLCSATADAGGAWSCAVTLAAGPHAIAVNQTDIAGNDSVDSATVSFTAKRTTTLAVGSVPNPSVYGGAVTFTATVSGGVSPTGTVQFRDGGLDLGSPVAVAAGAATLATGALGGGTHAITATYSGDGTHFGSTAPSADHVVNPATQAIAFDAPADRTVFSGSFPVSATSNSSLPVAITSQTAPVCAVAAGTVTLVSVGTCTLAADQPGNANYLAAPQVLRSFEVTKASTAATVASSANPASPGASVTFTATLTGTPAPTGTVTFKDGTATLGTGTLAGGTATFATSALATGEHAITAEYGGDANYSAATSPAIAQVVELDTTPDAFPFAPVTGVQPGDSVTSAAVTVAGLGARAAVSVANGEYSVGCTGTFTAAGGTISQGEAVCVRHVAPLALSAATTTTLTIGGVSSGFQSTTAATLDPALDADRDGIPNAVEANEGTDPLGKDNDVFANARLFAMQQYRDFLAREGDPDGILGWTAAVAAGAYTRPQAIEFFLGTPEFEGLTGSLVRLYLSAFARLPDYPGLSGNVAVMRAGATLQDVATYFVASPEGAAVFGALDNAQFVTHLYQDVLGRAPDAGGFAGWTAALDGGTHTRGQVLAGFADCGEFRARVANDVVVAMMYAGMLRRTPDPAGFAAWVGLLDGGSATRAQVIDGFLNAGEYRGRFLP